MRDGHRLETPKGERRAPTEAGPAVRWTGLAVWCRVPDMRMWRGKKHGLGRKIFGLLTILVAFLFLVIWIGAPLFAG